RSLGVTARRGQRLGGARRIPRALHHSAKNASDNTGFGTRSRARNGARRELGIASRQGIRPDPCATCRACRGRIDERPNGSIRMNELIRFARPVEVPFKVPPESEGMPVVTEAVRIAEAMVFAARAPISLADIAAKLPQDADPESVMDELRRL